VYCEPDHKEGTWAKREDVELLAENTKELQSDCIDLQKENNELKAQIVNIINSLKLIESEHIDMPYDANYIARCNPHEEQELGREQVLDEIRALIRKFS
jgi:hypothetical protein